MTPRSRAGLLLGGTLLVGVLALGPAGDSGAAGGGVCEGIVVDDGPNTGQQSWSSVAVQTANVAPGSSDLDALSAAGDTPTQNGSGLVCAINDYPPDGLQNCLATSGAGYDYWSYWQGDPSTNTWAYAQIGPASHTVDSGQTYVEGWRYQSPGPDNPDRAEAVGDAGSGLCTGLPGCDAGAGALVGGSLGRRRRWDRVW